MASDRPAPERLFVSLESPTARRAGAGGHPCQGLYWAAAGTRPKTAIIATHFNVDFAEHYLAPWFAERGFGFLGWNTRFRGAEDLFALEHALVDIGVGVRWLREAAGAERIVLLGNSGGGSLMAAYQACAGDGALAAAHAGPVGEALAALVPADLYLSLNAHRGRPEVLTNWLDASLTDESDPTSRDPGLDIYDPANGPPYDPEFVARVRAAQRARNHRISAWARSELARLQAAGVPDRLFPLFRGWADPRFMDGALDPSKRPCPACYAGDPMRANRGIPALGRSSSLRAWLAMWSLEDSPCQGPEHLARLRLPALVVQSLGDTGVFPSDARAIFEALPEGDKQLEWVPGAHYFEDDMERRRDACDLISAWIARRA